MTLAIGFTQNYSRPITNSSGGNLYSSQGSKSQDLWNKAVSRFRESITTGQTKRTLEKRIFGLATSDSEGVEKLELFTIFNALELVNLLPTRLPIPEVDIDPDGEISFEWYRSSNKLLSISIGQDGRLAYAGRLGLKRISGIDYLGEQFPNELAAFIEKID
jgi:hypothetical protein